MRHTWITMVVLGMAASLGVAKEKVKPSVEYAKTWEAAVEEAKLLNVPIVVHSHGFYWGPCWSVHGSVLQNKKYIKFAGENTVEVMALGRLEEGIEKNDRKAATYKGKDGVEYLVEFPNLTVADIKALRSSKAGTYNNTGKIPYTAIVNPHNLEEMESIKGGYSSKTLMEIVATHKKALAKEHGKSLSRKVLTKIRKDQAEIEAEVAKEAYAKALAAVAKLEKSVAKQPDALIEMVGKVKAGVVDACGKKLDSLEALIGRGAKAEAAKELGTLARALKGTSLEERAHELLAQAKAE